MASNYRNGETTINEALQAFGSHMYRVADKVFDYFEGEKQEEMAETCKLTMEKCCNLEAQFKHNQKLVQRTAACFREEDNNRTVKDIYNELKNTTPACKDQHEEHLMYKNLMNVINNADKRVNKAGQPEEEDEDLQMTSMTVNTQDPFTKLEMTDPVMSSVCKHTFERATVMTMLQNKSRIRCATPGCGWITAAELVPNLEMQRIIEERQAKRKR